MIDPYTRPAPPSTNRRWLFAFAAAGLAVLLYTGAWLFLAATARSTALAWVEARRTEGYAVRFDSMEETGYPLSVRLDVVNPGIGTPNSPAPWGWEGETLEIELKPWDWATVTLNTAGKQTLALTTPKTGMVSYNGEAGSASASLDLDGGGLDIAIRDLSLKGDKPGIGGFAIAKGRLRAARPGSAGADARTPSAQLEVRLSELRLPRFLSSPLGDGVRELEIEARLLGDLAAGPVRDSLEAWRDGGGTVEIRRLAVRHGPMAVRADGTLALDGQLQPIGAFTARIEGFFAAIDALQKTGMVKARDAVTAKMILGVMSRRPENGGPATLNLALTLQDRRLFAGPVGLLEFGTIDWRTLWVAQALEAKF